MIKKTYLEAPQAELIVVRFEENFLNSPGDGYNNQGGGGSYGDGDTINNGDDY